MRTLILPYPISANRYWQSFVRPGTTRALVHLSTEAKAYKKEIGWLCVAGGIRTPMQGRLMVSIRLYPERPQDYRTRQRKFGDAWDDDVRCIDLGNAEKVLSDALQGFVFEDDRQLWRITSERMEPDAGGARVVVIVDHLPPRSPVVQLELMPPAPPPAPSDPFAEAIAAAEGRV